MTGPQAPPGWHPDPNGEPGWDRYWDGTAWTDQRRPAAPVAAPAAAPSMDPLSRLRRLPLGGKIAAGVATFVVLGVCGNLLDGTDGDEERPTVATTVTQVAPTTEPAATAAPSTTAHATAFDVAAMVGQTIDGVRTALGPPEDAEPEPSSLQADLGVDEWSNQWTKGTTALLVTFDTKSRRIVDFFLSDGSVRPTDTASLLRLGNLSQESPSYTVEFVKARNGDGFTGMKVIPA